RIDYRKLRVICYPKASNLYRKAFRLQTLAVAHRTLNRCDKFFKSETNAFRRRVFHPVAHRPDRSLPITLVFITVLGKCQSALCTVEKGIQNVLRQIAKREGQEFCNTNGGFFAMVIR